MLRFDIKVTSHMDYNDAFANISYLLTQKELI